MEVLGPRSSSFAGQGGRFSSGPRKFTVYRLWVDLGFRGFRVWGGGVQECLREVVMPQATR